MITFCLMAERSVSGGSVEGSNILFSRLTFAFWLLIPPSKFSTIQLLQNEVTLFYRAFLQMSRSPVE